MSKDNIQLAWDIKNSRINLNDVNVIVIPEKLAPVNVAAIVEEQDIALVLSMPSKLSVTDDKPCWYLANKLESQDTLQPGSVIIRDGKTIKIMAIIHDLDQDPTYKPEWISKALDNIFSISNSYGIRTMQLPILGAQYGRFKLGEFLLLLVNKINIYEGPLEEIWLIIPHKDCPKALSYLKEIA